MKALYLLIVIALLSSCQPEDVNPQTPQKRVGTYEPKGV